MSCGNKTVHLKRTTSKCLLESLDVPVDSPIHHIIEQIEDQQQEREGSVNDATEGQAVEEDNCVDGNEKQDDSNRGSFDLDMEEVDPRVGGALEALNIATDNVNQAELDLRSYQNYHKKLVQEVHTNLNVILKPSRMRNHVERAAPYFMAHERLLSLQEEVLLVATEFENRNKELSLAKENLLKLEKKEDFVSLPEYITSKELLSQSNEACELVEQKYADLTSKVMSTQRAVEALQQERHHHIRRSKHYYVEKDRLEKEIIRVQRKINRYTKKAQEGRELVKLNLKNLEQISEEIHDSRNNVPSRTETPIEGQTTSSEPPLTVKANPINMERSKHDDDKGPSTLSTKTTHSPETLSRDSSVKQTKTESVVKTETSIKRCKSTAFTLGEKSNKSPFSIAIVNGEKQSNVRRTRSETSLQIAINDACFSNDLTYDFDKLDGQSNFNVTNKS